MRPRLLDLFCGVGGAAMGYARAGFDVVGVDIVPQPRYPFRFWQLNAFDLEPWVLMAFDAVHASPPCQVHASLRVATNAREHGDAIPATRALLRASGRPYVIENVVGAPLINPVRVCGSSLGLGTDTHELRRHRLFECSFAVLVPPCAHNGRRVLGIYGDHARDNRRASSIATGHFTDPAGLAAARDALDIPWATWPELTQAIPPAYTELIGGYLRDAIEAPV